MNLPVKAVGQVQRQVQLPLSKAVEIALKSMRVRLGRSILTLITIVMAMAFLTQVWLSNRFGPVIRTALLAKAHLAVHEPVADNGRLVWLISLSLLVCLVGISNAMLMSVMERFREIGTMKCLGALDSFILKLFLLESIFLGVAGTVCGIVLGVALAAAMMVVRYSTAAWSLIPWGGVPWVCLAALGIGTAITAAAAMYPAWKAARMEPIAAMRVEV
ncbi:MAG: FtsX-like permease family protein [Phycisphaerae bacterium]|nr:FtsX-like permease family protein [Phycisphaerae bacterium]